MDAKEKAREIVKWLIEQEGIAFNPKLWDVLTALRGPDNGDNMLKAATTEVIRHACGMKDITCGAYASKDTQGKAVYRKGLALRGHFQIHARLAFEALDLKWDKCNKD